MKTLTVLYDGACGFCRRCREWLEGQPPLLRLEFVPAQSGEAVRRFPSLARPDRVPEELVVVSDEGGVYRGAEAWIMVLYALEEYREWSFRLADPLLLPMARSVVQMVSKGRYSLSHLLGLEGKDLAEAIARAEPFAEACPAPPWSAWEAGPGRSTFSAGGPP